jgi:2-hydroxychromene-2-carboxylate isomerase
MKHIDVFYFFGSVYAYLSVMRIRSLADEASVSLRWRPFNVRTVMKENNVALRTEALKVPYMWRDIERRAASHGLPFTPPPVWPTDPELLHNLTGALAASEGWGEDFTVASFRAWIVDRMPLGDPATLSHVLNALGKKPDMVLAEARSARVAKLYEAETEVARGHGIFGSPSFVANGEVFWGDDRLEEAIAWATGAHALQQRSHRS